MSFGIIAAGIGAAGSIAGGMMQGSAAGDAAGTMQGASLATQKMYQDAQKANDAMLTGAEARNQKAYKPWTRLGGQATRGLSRYLGYVPEYGVKKPANLTGAQLRTQWDKKHPGMKPKAGFEKRALAQQKNALAQWESGRAAFDAQQRASGDFGGYFADYGVPEPKYVPYKDYEQFTDKHLAADPLYATELNENVGAWDRSAASRGSLMSGNTVAGLREITAGGISRARGRHIEDYEQNRGNYLEDYGIGRDEWEGGYERDWNQRERKYNALTGMSNMGMQVADRRSNLRTGTAQGRIQNSQWGTDGQTGANMAGADAAASGQLSQGAAYGNAFNNVGQMAMLYGMGAFDDRDDQTQNAMTAPNRAGQNRWLAGWQQRQKQNNPGYNASWMPKAGWRGRFNQSQQQPAWKTVPKAPVPGSYGHTGDRPPRDPNPRPDGTYGPYLPPAPPVYSPSGWRTLAPVGVPEGGWGGGAIEHTPGHLISGPTAKEVRETGVPGQYGQYGGINPVVGPNGERMYGGMGAPPPAPTPPPPGKMGMNYGQAPGRSPWGPRTNAMMEY